MCLAGIVNYSIAESKNRVNTMYSGEDAYIEANLHIESASIEVDGAVTAATAVFGATDTPVPGYDLVVPSAWIGNLAGGSGAGSTVNASQVLSGTFAGGYYEFPSDLFVTGVLHAASFVFQASQTIDDVNSASGYCRVDDVQLCWGYYKSSATSTVTTDFPESFLDTSYGLLLTPETPAQHPRFAWTIDKGTDSFTASSAAWTGGLSSATGTYLAVGPYQGNAVDAGSIDDASGFVDIGTVRICWGIYASSITSPGWTNFPAVFYSNVMSIILTPQTDGIHPRFARVIELATDQFKAQTSTFTGSPSDGTGSYVAIGRNSEAEATATPEGAVQNTPTPAATPTPANTCTPAETPTPQSTPTPLGAWPTYSTATPKANATAPSTPTPARTATPLGGFDPYHTPTPKPNATAASTATPAKTPTVIPTMKLEASGIATVAPIAGGYNVNVDAAEGGAGDIGGGGVEKQAAFFVADSTLTSTANMTLTAGVVDATMGRANIDTLVLDGTEYGTPTPAATCTPAKTPTPKPNATAPKTPTVIPADTPASTATPLGGWDPYHTPTPKPNATAASTCTPKPNATAASTPTPLGSGDIPPYYLEDDADTPSDEDFLTYESTDSVFEWHSRTEMMSGWTGVNSITTLGTIGTGVWQGTAIGSAYLTEADPGVDTEGEIEAILGINFGSSKTATNNYFLVGDGTDWESTSPSDARAAIGVTSDWSQDSNHYIGTDEIRATDSGGVKVMNDAGTAGLTVLDSGYVNISSQINVPSIYGSGGLTFNIGSGQDYYFKENSTTKFYFDHEYDNVRFNDYVSINCDPYTPSNGVMSRLSVNGDIAYSGDMWDVSSREMKKDITYLSRDSEARVMNTSMVSVPVSYDRFRDQIRNATPAYFHFNIDDSTAPLRFGVIAEDLPSSAIGKATSEAIPYISRSGMRGFLTAVSQDQQRQLDEHEKRIAELEKLVSELEARIAAKD